MLTLGTEQLERQARIHRFREQQHRNQMDLWETLERKTMTVAPDGAIDTTDLERQIGYAMHSGEFMRRLKLMNPSLIFDRSAAFPNRIGIYTPRTVKTETGGWRTENMYIAAFEAGYLPERSVRHVKRTQMPDPDPLNKANWIEVEEFQRETRGWRTVLVRLLQERLITMPQVERMFPPSLSSRNWQLLTT